MTTASSSTPVSAVLESAAFERTVSGISVFASPCPKLYSNGLGPTGAPPRLNSSRLLTNPSFRLVRKFPVLGTEILSQVNGVAYTRVYRDSKRAEPVGAVDFLPVIRVLPGDSTDEPIRKKLRSGSSTRTVWGAVSG